ncbi:hypothetical protein J437_LFUL012145 [Ladona fulva]|uniref:RAB6-interacting golgin n=1 Tax=Ladona fulva TaxID=123851 RepID=A0A8K0KDL3_LADFU|nr:hypothetical protein J437_LFUL012145 [Ladona fulva]
MSGTWQGFTEEDIKSMNGKEAQLNGKPPLRKSAKQKIIDGKKESLFKSSAETNTSSTVEDIPKEARLSSPKVKPVGNEKNDASTPTVNHCEDHAKINEDTISGKLQTTEETPNINTVCLKIKNNVEYEVLGNEMKSTSGSLSDFHFRQKLMEEQNRKRKELLSKALADRKKKTRAEAQRLQTIQEELQKLDNLLSNDVSILRNQIEAACLDFAEAQKRYDKAEKEFLEAKIILFSKMEKKELLTGHLCTIIEQNELRKAKKLSELMEKLEMASVIPDAEKFKEIMEQSYMSSESMPVGTIKDPKLRNKLQESQATESTNGKFEKMQECEKGQDEPAVATENPLPSD